MKDPDFKPGIAKRFCLRLLAFGTLGAAQLLCAAAGENSMQGWRRGDGELTARFGNGMLSLRPLRPDAVQVRFEREYQASVEDKVLLGTRSSPYEVSEDATSLSLRTDRLSVRIDKASGSLRFMDASGRVFLSEQPGGRQLSDASVQGLPCLAAEQSFDAPEDERLFGGGQFQDGFLNLRDLPRRLTQVNTQISLPFFLSNRGYGLLWLNHGLTDLNPADTAIKLKRLSEQQDATKVSVTTSEGSREELRSSAVFEGEWRCEQPGRHAFLLDVGQKMARRWSLSIDGKVVVDFSNHWLPPTTSGHLVLEKGLHSIRVVGEKEDAPVLYLRPSAARTVLRSPVSKGINYVVFSGAPETVISGYRSLTGQAPMMPLWALGYIHCRERFSSQEQLLSTAREFRTRSLPMDLIVQDWQYWGRHGWNAMRFDEKDYPDPEKMVKDLHQMKARLMVSVWSRIDDKSEVGEEFARRGYYIPGTQWVDFFNREAAAFYWKNFSERMLGLGIDSWWLDATEPENDDLAGRMTAAGPGEVVRNLYPLLVNKTVYEGQRKDAPEKRVCILTRSAFSGQQRYGTATWSGDIGNDWETLRRQIPAGLNQMAAGVPWWTTDAGGFFRPGAGQYKDPAYHERFLRWLQFATFCPLMRVHGYQTDTEFWNFGETVEQEARGLLALRYRLLPYIYSQAWRVTAHGSTLMRPLVMDFVNDARALSVSDQYMFGPSLLVSPVLEPGAKTRSVYLPDGGKDWFDFWKGTRVKQRQVVTADAPLSRIPLHVPAGSILPLGQPRQTTAGQETEIELRIYPGAPGHFELYSDEGDTYGYEQGKYSLTRLEWDDARSTLRIGARSGGFPGMPDSVRFRIVKVREGHGAGDSATPTPDAEVLYKGLPVELKIP